MHQVNYSEIAHGSSPPRKQQSTVNGIFLHLLYGSVQFPEVGAAQCTKAVCTQIIPTEEVPWCTVHQVYNSKTSHGSSPHCTQHSAVNGIFEHLLYEFVQFPEVEPEQCT